MAQQPLAITPLREAIAARAAKARRLRKTGSKNALRHNRKIVAQEISSPYVAHRSAAFAALPEAPENLSALHGQTPGETEVEGDRKTPSLVREPGKRKRGRRGRKSMLRHKLARRRARAELAHAVAVPCMYRKVHLTPLPKFRKGRTTVGVRVWWTLIREPRHYGKGPRKQTRFVRGPVTVNLTVRTARRFASWVEKRDGKKLHGFPDSYLGPPGPKGGTPLPASFAQPRRATRVSVPQPPQPIQHQARGPRFRHACRVCRAFCPHHLTWCPGRHRYTHDHRVP